MALCKIEILLTRKFLYAKFLYRYHGMCIKPIIHGATLLHATCCTKLNGCQLGATCCMQQNRVSYTVQHVACNNVAPCMIAFTFLGQESLFENKKT